MQRLEQNSVTRSYHIAAAGGSHRLEHCMEARSIATHFVLTPPLLAEV